MLQQRHRTLKLLVLDRHAELDERLIKAVRHRVDALVHDHLGAPARALDILHVALDLENRHALWRVDRVPHAEVIAVLGHHHVAVGHPLHVGAEVEQRRLLLGREVVEVQVAVLVAKEQLRRRRVELEPVDLGVVVDGGKHMTRHEIQHLDGLDVHQVGDFLVVGRPRIGGLRLRVGRRAALVEAAGDVMGGHVLGAARAQDLVPPVLHQRQLPGVIHHTDSRVFEYEALGARAAPRHLGQLAGAQVTDEQRLGCVGHQVLVLVDVDLGDLVTLGRLEDKPLAGLDLLDDDLGEGYVSELELALVAGLFEADVEDVDGSTERANADPRAVLLPGDRSHGVVVLYLLAANFVPLWSLGVEVVDVEPVEVSDDGGLTAGVEGGAGVRLQVGGTSRDA